VAKTVTSGYTVVYPNREKATSKTTKLIVVLILLASVVLMLIVTLGGWSKLQGLKLVNLVWCAVYLIIAYYIWKRWSRGLLPMAAAMAILLLIMCAIAGFGLAGTSWFDRNHFGFQAPHTIFGGKALGPDVLGTLTVILIPVQAALIVFAMIGFAQAWNVETEVPNEEAERRGYKPNPPSSPRPATA
jgi:lysylphosphatidylglycerol synthetase-like protein (DUF2156 family)